MSATLEQRPISVDEYLANELVSQSKHEYFEGRMYLMTGARNLHNIIAGKL